MGHHHHKHTRRKFLGQLGVGCASMGMTTLLSSITNMGLLNAAAAANRPFFPRPQTSGYKALVCILLDGGNDSYNMLIPRGIGEYAEYASVRTNLAIPQADLLPINPLNPDGKDYGLHPNLSNIQTLFETGELAFLANVGAMVEPTTVADYQNSINLPQGLFSHSDQKTHWQTSIPQDRKALGWGGRMADILYTNNANQDVSMNISLDGINVFQQGNIIREYSIQNSGTGSVSVTGSDDLGFYESLKRETLDNILDVTNQNILETAFHNSVKGSTENSLQFATAIANGTPITTSFGNDDFSQELFMIAKTIAARNLLGVSNQTFFVKLNGFDTHDNILEDHGALMTQLDSSLKSFHDAMIELGVNDDVTSFTISDFARKLISNGNGTDHAWGGHALIMGGSVTGQHIYGNYPDLYIGNSLDAGNGRILPTTSCDEYFADLALWFGASSSDLNQILPNITNFWTPTTGSSPIGFMS